MKICWDNLEKLKKEIERLNGFYGLRYPKKPENIIEDHKNDVPYLSEIPELEIKKEPTFNSVFESKKQPTNILIEAENYHAVQCLQYTHKGKVDVIYIDPPYNTGNKDFIYNDSFVDRDDDWRHSKWLSFMECRLKLAKELLSDSGVIFISIDDNEFAQLKLLCDGIFGERNFIANLIWKKTGQQQNNGVNIAVQTEYILCYAKELYIQKKKELIQRDDIKDRKGFEAYHLEDNIGKFRINPIQHGSIGRYEYNVINPNTKEIINSNKWCIKKEDFEELEKNNMIYWTKKLPNVKKYLKDNIGVLRGSIIDGSSMYNEDSNRLLKKLDIIFDHSKPVELIKHLLKALNKNSIVLDFFAGSGTTGQAVLELNKEDHGNRQFILVTNNENNICSEVCYPRLKRVIEGYKKFEPLYGNLKYYKMDFEKYSENDLYMNEKMDSKIKDTILLKENIYNNIENMYNEDGKLVYNFISINDTKAIGILYQCGSDYEDELLERLSKFENRILYFDSDDSDIETYYNMYSEYIKCVKI